jgi:hypothetical protein
MSTLHDKINSYALERGIEFDQAFTTTPTRTGTNPLITAFTQNGTSNIVYEPTVGPAGGAGSWLFNWSTTSATNSYFRAPSSGSTEILGVNDQDYSVGFWFKLNDLPTGIAASVASLFQITSNSTGFNINISGSGNVGNPSKLFISIAGSTTFGDQPNSLQTNTWYYLAVRRQSNTLNIYLNNTLILSTSHNGTTAATTWMFGDTSARAFTGSYNISNYYLTTADTIGATQIAEIWTAGTSSGSTDVTILEEPATATALQVDATISAENIITISETLNASAEFPNPTLFTTLSATVLSDPLTADALQVHPSIITTTEQNSVNIVTSILVTSEMVEPLFTTDISVTILLDFSLDASSDAVDPTLSFTSDAINSSEPVTASAESVDPSLTITANQNISVEAYAVSATFPDNIYVTSDDEVVYSATPMFASNAEIPNPSWGAVNPDPLYYLPGTLRSKIATYPIQWGIELATPGTGGSTANSIPMYGSLITSSPQSLGTNQLPGSSSISTDGPVASGAGSTQLNQPWNITSSNTTLTTLLGTQPFDHDYTYGLWFKVPTLPTGTVVDAMSIFRLENTTYTDTIIDFAVNVSGTSHATNPSQLNITLNRSTYDYVGTIDPSQWYYLAIRRTGTTGTNNFEVYLNGQLVLTKTNTDTVTQNRVFFGGNQTYQNGILRVQNFHMSTSSNVNAFRVNEIYLAGTNFPPAQSISVTHNAPPAFANATMIAPTVVAVLGDNVQIATSILVSSLMVNPDFSTGERVTVNAEVLGTASADIGDNITLDTFKDHVQAPEEFTATAVMVMPRISEFPFYATAQLVNPQVFISPNRFAMVMNQNPLFYIEDGQPNPTNYGSWDVNSWDVSFFDTNVQAGQELNAVGNQKSWRANANGLILSEPEIKADITDYEQKIEALYASKKLSIELWYWSIAEARGFETGFGQYTESGILFSDGITQIGEVYDWFGCGPNTNPANEFVLISNLIDVEFGLGEGSLPFVTYRTYYDAQPKRYQWNQVVITYEPIVGEPGKINQKVYMNGSIISNLDLVINNAFGEFNFSTNFNSPSMKGPQLGYSVNLTGSQQLKLNDGVKLDEFAIYPVTLTSNQVVERYNFIRSLSPDAEYLVDARDSQAAMGNHTFVAVANFVFDEDPMPALAARIPEPEVLAATSKFIFPAPHEADAEFVDPAIQTGVNYLAQPMPANSELILPSISSNLYYQYVKSTINPYRYVSFDTNNELEDQGTDNDYSVIPTQIFGNITEYKDGINNKSVKTNGLSYQNGVVLKESEWNDSWGTGQNTYHSAFWVQRAEDDNSSGLRVLWNLNGYVDDQHVILYQYNNKLHLNFNNGLGTFIDQATVEDIDLFNYANHLVVIAFDHTNNNNNVVRLYVDTALVMTVNLGSYTGTTLNYETSVDANDEQYNQPRLGVGCLITPFATTALVALPTVTKLYVDEIYWAKSAITLTGVQNLYNAMPVKIRSLNFVTPLTASATSVMPAVSASVNFVANNMLAFAAQEEPVILSVVNLVLTSDPLTASALMANVERSDSRVVVAEVMLAGSSMGGYGTPRLINVAALTASALLQNRRITGQLAGSGNGIRINGINTFDPSSAWVKYVKINNESSIIPMGGVN